MARLAPSVTTVNANVLERLKLSREIETLASGFKVFGGQIISHLPISGFPVSSAEASGAGFCQKKKYAAMSLFCA